MGSLNGRKAPKGSPELRLKNILCMGSAVEFVQFIFVEPVFIQRCFRPTLDPSNLLSSMTYICPICFHPILVPFLFLSKNTRARFGSMFGVFAT